VASPREDSYGHQALELLMTLHLAEAAGADACLRRPARVPNRALFSLECREVRLRHGLAAVGPRWLAGREQGQPPPARPNGKVKVPPPDFLGVDFRERYAHRPLSLRLPGPVERRAVARARQLGLADEAPIVTLHVRESGFKQAGRGEAPVDAIRNASIASYVPAIEWLHRRGFTVVRVGDPFMTPFACQGLIDLARSPLRDDALELHLMARSRFFIGGDSGPICAALVTGTPALAVNVTNVMGAYPVRAADRYILKHVRRRDTQEPVAVPSLLTDEYFTSRKDLTRYEFGDNTEDELLEAVQEMAAPEDLTVAQARFHALAEAQWRSPAVAARRVKKGEPADQLLGEGALGRAFAERHVPVR
jgi:putative glycosyltransferase (TIGR04372 family)